MLTLDSIRKTQAKVSEILLAPSASMTSAGSSPMRCTASPHARDRSPGWCTRKPREPFFSIQFLTTLAEERLVELDARTAAWRWDVQRIEARASPTTWWS